MADKPFDIEAAREHFRKRISEKAERRRELWLKAKVEAEQAVQLLIDRYKPSRIIQWGSVLKPEYFTEASDIDIAVEGIDDVEVWSDIERDLISITSFPLDLVRFDRLHPEHQSQILASGKVVYER